MAFALADRVQETSTTTGLGTLTLGGALLGFTTFSAAVGNGNATFYAVTNPGTAEWEVGIGTVSAAALSRDTVTASSNAGSFVSFSAGTKTVMCALPASALSVAGAPRTAPMYDDSGFLSTPDQTSLAGAAGAEAFRAVPTSSGVNWIEAKGATTGNPAIVAVNGSDPNPAMVLQSQGTGSIYLRTNGAGAASTGYTQLRALNTTSAVNYVQVTGGTTGNGVVLSSQGTNSDIKILYKGKGYGTHEFWCNDSTQFAVSGDPLAVNYGLMIGSTTGNPIYFGPTGETNCGLDLNSHGNGTIRMRTGGPAVQAAFTHTASAVNYHNFTGGASGSGVTWSAQGNGTDIDLIANPKGAGLFRIGTTSTAASVAANFTADRYLPIKDGSGTTYYVPVRATTW